MNESYLNTNETNSISVIISIIKSIVTNLIKNGHTQIKRVIFSKNHQGNSYITLKNLMKLSNIPLRSIYYRTNTKKFLEAS